MREETYITKLEPREFIIHITHELRQDSSYIDACSKMMEQVGEENLSEQQKLFLKMISERVEKIKFLENKITEWLTANP